MMTKLQILLSESVKDGLRLEYLGQDGDLARDTFRQLRENPKDRTGLVLIRHPRFDKRWKAEPATARAGNADIPATKKKPIRKLIRRDW